MPNIFILGSLNMDLSVTAPTMPQAGETLTGSAFFMNPGGKGANQAVAISLAGGQAVMIGALGRAFAEPLMKALTDRQVDVRFVRQVSDVASGTAVIIVTEGDNRIILDPGANAWVDERLVDKALREAHPGDYLLCQLEIPVTTVRYALKKAKALGMVTFLNAAPAQKLPDDVFPNIDYFFPNQSETEFYTGFYPENEVTASIAAYQLLQRGVHNVLVTLGDKGAFFMNDQERVLVPGFAVKVVDTTAAGDTFIGTLLTHLGEGKSIEEAMRTASAAAAVCITRRGAQASIPTREETAAFLRSEPWTKR